MARRVDPAAAAEERARLVAVASELLQREGPDALTNRRVAKEAGMTTMALYSRLGGKGGLMDALVLEGFARLAEAQASIPPEPAAPLTELRALCLAFRTVALAYPQHYQLMFGRTAEWAPGPAVQEQGLRTLQRLAEALGRTVEAGYLQGDPVTLAWQVFATAHGHIVLELSTLGVPEGVDAEVAYVSSINRLLGVA